MKKTTLVALAGALTMAVSAHADMKNTTNDCMEMNGKCVSTKSAEGKCGEGKCGATTPKKNMPKSAEGKCGEGKCGASK
ncbi:HvfA family oxazolone/thioamide-modified RiPP metallophore [Histophilus somni]|uniref:HvfA family oxazolone/thioamide-modified RiPP metallophore n=1 Tax=Histophilus somni TaxID=731 RepID=UPI00003945FD|nr:membrane protein [Histophilus somni]